MRLRGYIINTKSIANLSVKFYFLYDGNEIPLDNSKSMRLTLSILSFSNSKVVKSRLKVIE